jgi:hypothetical protein
VESCTKVETAEKMMVIGEHPLHRTQLLDALAVHVINKRPVFPLLAAKVRAKFTRLARRACLYLILSSSSSVVVPTFSPKSHCSGNLQRTNKKLH